MPRESQCGATAAVTHFAFAVSFGLPQGMGANLYNTLNYIICSLYVDVSLHNYSKCTTLYFLV